jgi:hypothetical protein
MNDSRTVVVIIMPQRDDLNGEFKRPEWIGLRREASA